MPDSELVDRAIRERKTIKILAPSDLPLPDSQFSDTTMTLLELAGMAPFHRACDACHREAELPGIEPWRFYVLPAPLCRQLGPTLNPDKAGKIPRMLAAADSLLLCTWLPNPPSDPSSGALFEPTLGNMEHIAAASAAIQNLLVAATARGIANYWSSGGVLRDSEQFERLGIPSREILLGAIFLFPEESANAEIAESKLRPKRCKPDQWSTVINKALR